MMMKVLVQMILLLVELMKMKQKIIIPILMLITLSSIVYAQVEGNANLLGWAYNATNNTGLS